MNYKRITNGKYCERCYFCEGKVGESGYSCCGSDGDVEICGYGTKSRFIKNIELLYSRDEEVRE